ncbi:hypothetical protein [Sphingobacterium siyangense]|uniref:hypothetical protein n=1 Tax=Sphingobacterium siyangense TaxID=459529 RepID=UPI003DA3BD75
MEEIEPSQIYLKGYNAGYMLNKYEPKLLSQILANENRHHEFIKALYDGGKQWQKEKMVEEMSRGVNKNRGQSIE